MPNEPQDKLEPDFRPHFEAWRKEPSPAHTTRLLDAVHPVLDTGIKAFGGPDSPLIRSRAKRIALDALQSYDPQKAALKTHLLNHLQGLQRHAHRQARMLSMPERVALERSMLSQHENILRDELGREPTSLELADRTGIPLKRQEKLRRYTGGFAEGQTMIGFNDEDGPVDVAIQHHTPLMRKLEVLKDDLDPTDQAIVEHAAGLYGRQPIPATDLARKLNLTPGRISQRTAAIQRKLDELDDLGIF